MKAWKIKQYLPALLLYMQRRVEGGRGAVVAVRTRDICGVDRRCCMVMHMLMMRLVEKGPRQETQEGHLPNREGCRGGGVDGFEGVDMTAAVGRLLETGAATSGEELV